MPVIFPRYAACVTRFVVTRTTENWCIAPCIVHQSTQGLTRQAMQLTTGSSVMPPAFLIKIAEHLVLDQPTPYFMYHLMHEAVPPLRCPGREPRSHLVKHRMSETRHAVDESHGSNASAPGTSSSHVLYHPEKKFPRSQRRSCVTPVAGSRRMDTLLYDEKYRCRTARHAMQFTSPFSMSSPSGPRRTPDTDGP